MSKQEEEVQIASPLPVILSGLINGAIYCYVYHLSIQNAAESAQNQLPLLIIGFFVSTIVWAQIFFRRSIQTKVTFLKLLVAGWMSSLIFALVVVLFYNWYAVRIDAERIPIAQALFSYSSMGLLISAMIAFLISRKK